MIINGFNITPQNGDKGTFEISINTIEPNEGIDKEIVVEGICGNDTAPLTLLHEGMREVFNFADGAFIMADGGTFNVLKE